MKAKSTKSEPKAKAVPRRTKDEPPAKTKQMLKKGVGKKRAEISASAPHSKRLGH